MKNWEFSSDYSDTTIRYIKFYVQSDIVIIPSSCLSTDFGTETYAFRILGFLNREFKERDYISAKMRVVYPVSEEKAEYYISIQDLVNNPDTNFLLENDLIRFKLIHIID